MKPKRRCTAPSPYPTIEARIAGGRSRRLARLPGTTETWECTRCNARQYETAWTLTRGKRVVCQRCGGTCYPMVSLTDRYLPAFRRALPKGKCLLCPAPVTGAKRFCSKCLSLPIAARQAAVDRLVTVAGRMGLTPKGLKKPSGTRRTPAPKVQAIRRTMTEDDLDALIPEPTRTPPTPQQHPSPPPATDYWSRMKSELSESRRNILRHLLYNKI